MTDAGPPDHANRLEITIFQLAPDEVFKRCRSDGAGWDWSWADLKRGWMEETSSKFAYRCLPLSIANQTGWWVRNPIGFRAVWRGAADVGGVAFQFDSMPGMWSGWVTNQFGYGIITWKTPFLFRTKPQGSRLLVCGPANYFKHGIQPLMAIIESDWMTMSFTMNWKFTAPNTVVRFDAGEPIFQVIPIATNLGVDLEEARVRYMKLEDDPEMDKAYHAWYRHRRQFKDDQAKGVVDPDAWQKDYFLAQGLAPDADVPGHRTKLVPPTVEYPAAPGREQSAGPPQ